MDLDAIRMTLFAPHPNANVALRKKKMASTISAGESFCVSSQRHMIARAGYPISVILNMMPLSTVCHPLRKSWKVSCWIHFRLPANSQKYLKTTTEIIVAIRRMRKKTNEVKKMFEGSMPA